MSSRRRAMLEWWRLFTGHATASVIPYGADSRTIKKELRGKVPGTLNRRNGLWSGTTYAVVGRFMTEAEARRADEDGASVGIYGDIFPAIDIDVDDEVLVNEILALAFKTFGLAPIRRREGSVRCLLMYAGRSLRRRRIAWGGGENVKESAVELLGRGQYWNADGLHPSGKPYYWDDHPCDLGVHDIIEITAEQWDTFQAAVAALVESRGLKVKVSGAKANGAPSGARTGLDDPSLWAPSPQVVLDLLAGYRPEVLGHNEFVTHMVAIKASLGSSREDYYPNILEWAPGVRSTEDDATRKVWDSIDDAEVGWGWLVDKSGSPAAAATDFQDPPPDDAMPADKSPDTIAYEGMLDRYVYWREADRFVDLVTAELLRPKAFNAINAIIGRIAKFGKRGEQTAEAKFINMNGRQVDMATYRPGRPRLICEEVDGAVLKAVNLYKPSILKLPTKLIRPDHWLGHLEQAFPEPWALKHFLQWNAFLFQFPGERIGHAPVIISRQGIGKDTLLGPIMKGLGDHNVEFIRSEQLVNPQFTSYLKFQLIICDELMNSERPTAYNTLKTLIANPREWRTINEKNITPYRHPNNQNYMFFGNKMNAITMEEDDRRLWVYEIIMQKMMQIEFVKLRAALDGGETVHAVKWLMEEIDLGDFQRFDAPDTPSKRAMMKETRPAFVNWLYEQFEESGLFYGRMFITTEEIRTSHDEYRGPVPDHQITSTLRHLDFVRIEGPHRDGETLIFSIWTRKREPEILNSKGALLVARLKSDQKKR
jgi:hypothetical protein